MSQLKINIDTTEAIKEMKNLKYEIEQVEKSMELLSKAALRATFAIRDCCDDMNGLSGVRVRPIA